MSYDLDLVDKDTGRTIILDHKHDLRGGTYVMGGTREATLNVTYNYSNILYRIFPEKGIRILEGLSGRESIPFLSSGILELKTDYDEDYWKPTEGNVRLALEDLRKLAELAPDGIWRIC